MSTDNEAFIPLANGGYVPVTWNWTFTNGTGCEALVPTQKADCYSAKPEFAFAEQQEGKGKKRDRFRILVASGQRIAQHHIYSNLYIDLEGIQIPSQKLPVLLNHDAKQRIGYTDRIELTDDGLVAEGYFLSNALAKSVVEDAREGFPWQASCYLPSESLEHIEPGSMAEVNGQEVTGPAFIHRRTTLREVTVTAVGADMHTKTEAMSAGVSQVSGTPMSGREAGNTEGKTQVTKTQDSLTVDRLKAEHAEVYSALRDLVLAEAKADAEQKHSAAVDAAVKAERERAAKILRQATASQVQMAAKFVADGTKVEDAFEAFLADPRRNAVERKAELFAAAPPVIDGSANGESNQAPADTPDAWAAEYAAKKELQDEFGDVSFYVAFKKAEANGLVKIKGGAS